MRGPRLKTRGTGWTKAGALSLAALLALAGCRASLPIERLLDDPALYQDRKVRVVGEVTESAGILGYGAYRVSDGTASLVVVSRRGEGVPRAGARVRVDGWFRSMFTLGRQSVAALQETGRGRP